MSKLLVPVLMMGLVSATASLASPTVRHAPSGGQSEAEFAARHQERCADRFALQVGRIAYLEARLDLADAQRPAFDKWKSAVLETAKSEEGACSAHTMRADHPPSILDREAREQIMLKTRLSALESELPALQALYQTLSPEQKLAFDKPRMGERGHGRRHGGYHDWHDRGSNRGAPPAAG